MTQPEPEYTSPASPSSTRQLPPAPPTTQLRPPRRSCASQILGFIGWVLTLALSVALALAAAAAILYFFFGLNLATPDQIRRASGDVAALQQQAQALETQVALLRTAEAEQAGSVAASRERIDELEGQVAEFARQAGEIQAQGATAAALVDELDQNIALAATLQAQNREDQVLVSVFATVQADNTLRIDAIQQRTDRIVRFLQRLGDLAVDVTGDDGTPLPTSSPIPTPTATAEALTPTPTP